MIFDSGSQPSILRKSKLRENETICSVSGCKDPAVRSISMKKVQSALSGIETVSKRAHLCKKHYKEYKKKTKDERELERVGWD